jgi:hypothetical protein
MDCLHLSYFSITIVKMSIKSLYFIIVLPAITIEENYYYIFHEIYQQ